MGSLRLPQQNQKDQGTLKQLGEMPSGLLLKRLPRFKLTFRRLKELDGSPKCQCFLCELLAFYRRLIGSFDMLDNHRQARGRGGRSLLRVTASSALRLRYVCVASALRLRCVCVASALRLRCVCVAFALRLRCVCVASALLRLFPSFLLEGINP